VNSTSYNHLLCAHCGGKRAGKGIHMRHYLMPHRWERWARDELADGLSRYYCSGRCESCVEGMSIDAQVSLRWEY
jgi:hypothetical protein